MKKSLNIVNIIFLLASLFLTSNLYAKADNPLEAIQTIMTALEKDLLADQQKLKANPEYTSGILEKHILPIINFKIMSQYVLGKHWRKATKLEQQEFNRLFSQLLIRFYTKAFIEYVKTNNIHSGMIEFLPYHAKENSKQARIKTKLKLTPSSPPIAVNYSLYNSKKSGWKAYDISVEGISLVTTYRSSFDQIIKQSKMPGLLKHIQEKIDNIQVKNQKTEQSAKNTSNK
ncbi:MAG: ABC transporter substrate-binding protein [Gammaproteobacteria bacterium]|nr:ABC transporter substrate-binding protein [Gammaproteobacteria bacterium]